MNDRRAFLACVLLVAAAAALPLFLPLLTAGLPAADAGFTAASSLDRIERGPLAESPALPPILLDRGGGDAPPGSIEYSSAPFASGRSATILQAEPARRL